MPQPIRFSLRVFGVLLLVLSGCSRVGRNEGANAKSPSRTGVSQSGLAVSPPAASQLGATSNALLAAQPEGYWRLNDFDSTMRDYSFNHIDGQYHDAYSQAQPPAVADDGSAFSTFFNGGYAEVDNHRNYSLTRFWDDFSVPNCLDCGSCIDCSACPTCSMPAGSLCTDCGTCSSCAGCANSVDQCGGDSWGPAWTAEVTTAIHAYFTWQGSAYIDPGGVEGTFEQGVEGTTLLHGQMQIRARWSAHASGGPLQPLTLVAHRVDENNMVRAELQEFADHTLWLFLIDVVNGQNTYVAVAQLVDGNGAPSSYAVGDFWWLRFEFDGPVLRARAWRDGDLEPGWQAAGVATSSNDGSVAVRSANSFTVQPIVEFKDFWVQTTGLTVSAFVRVPDPSVYPQGVNGEGDVFPLGKAAAIAEEFTEPNQEYYFRYEPTRGLLKAYVFSLNGGFGAGQDVPETVQIGKWYHMVMTLDPGDFLDPDAGMSLYSNGRLRLPGVVGGGALYKHDWDCIDHCRRTGNPVSQGMYCNGDPSQGICWMINPLNGDAPFDVGRSEHPFDQGPFTGNVEEVAVYSRKLTCDEVTSIYNAACNRADLPLSSGLNVSASSSQPLHPPTAAIDGDFTSTFWSSVDTSPGQFFRVDLGTARDIASVQFKWLAPPATFEMFVSADGRNFFDPTGTVFTGQPGFQVVPIGANARFIDVHLLTPSAAVYSLLETQVYPCDVALAACANMWPVAVVGGQQTAFVGQLVQLDGTGSFDPDPDAGLTRQSLTYAWTVTAPDGGLASVTGSDTPAASFVPDAPGTFLASLVVTDFGFATDSSGQIPGGPPASSYPATTAVAVLPASALVSQNLGQASALAEGLSPADVTTPGNLQAFTNLLAEATRAFEAAKYDIAQQKTSQALARTDGWSLRGAPDAHEPGRDWITAKAPATTLYGLLSQTLAALKTL